MQHNCSIKCNPFLALPRPILSATDDWNGSDTARSSVVRFAVPCMNEMPIRVNFIEFISYCYLSTTDAQVAVSYSFQYTKLPSSCSLLCVFFEVTTLRVARTFQQLLPVESVDLISLSWWQYNKVFSSPTARSVLPQNSCNDESLWAMRRPSSILHTLGRCIKTLNLLLINSNIWHD